MKQGEEKNKLILVMCAICYKLTVICFSTDANGKSLRARNIGILTIASTSEDLHTTFAS